MPRFAEERRARNPFLHPEQIAFDRACVEEFGIGMTTRAEPNLAGHRLRLNRFDLAIRSNRSLSNPMIHPTAVIHSKAKLDTSVTVGPYAVIDEAVEIGAGCIVGPHVYLTGVTTIGAQNQFHAGCVIGD